jgi:hypothetical protein
MQSGPIVSPEDCGRVWTGLVATRLPSWLSMPSLSLSFCFEMDRHAPTPAKYDERMAVPYGEFTAHAGERVSDGLIPRVPCALDGHLTIRNKIIMLCIDGNRFIRYILTAWAVPF